jgi:protein involved in polysaccharide export with SLBB domain
MKFRSLLLGLVLLATDAAAQEFSRVEETTSNSTSYYYYVQPGSATIETYVMGTVRSPGLYIVQDGTDLGQLLALSGGPILDVLDQTRRRQVTIRLFRPLAYSDRPIYEIELGRAVVQREPYPILRNGDILTVEIVEARRFDWRDLLTVVGGLSALAIAVERGVAALR